MYLQMYNQIFVKLIVGFVVLFVAAKFIGSRELRQLNIFDFITAMVLSELVGNILYQEDVNALHMCFALLCWTVLIYLVDKVTLKFASTRKLLDGETQLVVEEGIIDKKALTKHRMEISELLGLLREKDIFSLREVRFAFLEPDGDVSVVKGETLQYGQGDISGLPMPVVMDGRIVKLSLQRLNKDEEWLLHELQKKSVPEVKQIFYAEYLKGYGLLVQMQP